MTKLSDNALVIAKDRYFIDDKEDWEGLSKRVAREAANAETDKEGYTNKFSEVIYNMDFLPAGRILRNAGRPRGSLFNCYVVPVGDSIEEIGQFMKDTLILWSEGGGCGTNLSYLRPEGTPIKGKGGVSSGPISFLQASDSLANTVESGGSRRAAALACMNISHPDVIKFIDAKHKQGILSHYNISVAITEDFIEAVERDIDWEFKFAQQSCGKVKARELWDKLMENSVKYAEPGLLNWDKLRSNNSYYFSPVESTNPCQPSWATVLTRNGISTIGDIKKNDIIWSENGWTRVLNKQSSGIKDVYKYRTNASVFYGTKNHKVISNGEKIEVENAESIDRLRGSINSTNYEFDNNSIIDGLVVGDGSVHKASNNLVYLIIGKDDFDYFDSEISELIKKERTGLHKGAYEVITSITSSELPLTYKRGVPNRFKFNNHTIIRSFLRGLFSANGSVIESANRITLKSSSSKLVEDVQIMLSAVGIASYITSNKEHSVEFDNGVYTCKESYDINITGKDKIIFWNIVGFIQKYKMDKLTKLIDNKTSKSKETYDIVSEEYISTEEVFDITVDAVSHTYWSDGCNVSNCGEAPLSAYECCDLGSLVLPNFVSNTNTNWKKLDATIALAVRFLDNIITINKYVLKQIEINANNGRRIGVGILGLAEYLFAKKLRYGSEKAIAEVEKLMKFIRDSAYRASIELAVDKGAFPKFDPIQYGKAHFIRELSPSMRLEIKNKGIRNVTCLAIAPTGTISLLAEVSSGIEPLFLKAFMRKDRVSERLYVHPIYKNLLKSGEEIPEWYVDSYDLSPSDHLDTQVAVQYYVDGAVSKTVNMPKGTTPEQLSELTLEYIKSLKGLTVFVDGSRENQILNPVDHKTVLKHLEEIEGNVFSEDTVKCATGTCEI